MRLDELLEARWMSDKEQFKRDEMRHELRGEDDQIRRQEEDELNHAEALRKWMSNRERVYLNVPFSEKAAAKNERARWDGEKRQWYVMVLNNRTYTPPEGYEHWLDTADKKPSSSKAGDGRQYLKVPYSEKDVAKSKGARWDPTKKQWYVLGQFEPPQGYEHWIEN